MAMTYATISGKITQPGTDIGIRATVTATALTTAGALKFPSEDRITWGPQTAQTDSAGVLATLRVPTNHGMPELYWKITATPLDKIPGLTSWTIGTFEITANARLDDLVEIDTMLVSSDLIETMSDLVADAEAAAADVAAVLATNDGIMAAVAADDESDFSGVLSASYGVPLRSYGAAGDGVANDRPALIAAATAAVSFGAPLHMPAGDYKVTSTWAAPAGLRIIADVGATITGNLAGDAVLSVDSNTTIEGLTVENEATSACMGVLPVADAEGVTLRGCTFLGEYAQAVDVRYAGISGITVDNCTFDGVSYGFLSNGTGVGGADDLHAVRITNNRFLNIVNDAIELNHPAAAVRDTSRTDSYDFIVTGNTIHIPADPTLTVGTGFGVGVAGAADVLIANNTFIFTRTSAIHVEDQAYRVSILGNIIREVGGDHGTAGIEVLPSCRQVTVIGNTVENVTRTGSFATTGISIAYDANPLHSSDVVVSGNTVRNIEGNGILFGGLAADSAARIIATSNTVTDCGANGISINGTIDTCVVVHNIISGCAGYGVALPTAQPRLLTLTPNTITDCTSGDYQGGTISSIYGPTVLTERSFRIAPSVAANGGGTLTQPLFRVGSFCDGVVVLAGDRTGPARSRAVFRIRWDGTTFRATSIGVQNQGTTAHSSLSVIDGVLNWAVYVTTASATLDFVTAKFTGVMLEDSAARSGTVSATSPVAVTGSRGGNAALASLLTQLAAQGIVTDSTTA